jgi:hypothetical protein
LRGEEPFSNRALFQKGQIVWDDAAIEQIRDEEQLRVRFFVRLLVEARKRRTLTKPDVPRHCA